MLFPVLGLKTSHPSLQSAGAGPATSVAELGTPPFVLLHLLGSIQALAGFDVLPCFESILLREKNNVNAFRGGVHFLSLKEQNCVSVNV